MFLLNIKSSYTLKSINSKLKHSNINKYNNNYIYKKLYIIFSFNMLIFLFFIRGEETYIWFNHLKLNNSILFLINVYFFIFIFIFINLLNKINSLKNLNNDYYLSVIFVNFIIPIFFFTTNILTLFFLIELVSIIILYQFVVGRDWDNFLINKNKYFNFNNLNKGLNNINIIFFQYWISFFSTILLVYSIISFLFFFGTTDWILLNFLSFYENNNNIFINYIILFLAFFLKLGISPIHFYKIEIYKSLPFITIFFYTIFFFYIFFVIFGFIFTLFLNSFSWIFNIIGLLIIFISVVFIILYMYDITILKAFFAYSTIINSLSFFIMLINLCN